MHGPEKQKDPLNCTDSVDPTGATPTTGTAAKIRALELDSRSALLWAQEGKVEAWVHKFLLSGLGGETNPAFSEGLKREKRWWNGPILLALDDLTPAVGPQPGMEYVVDQDIWLTATSQLAETFRDAESLPPLIAEYRAGALSLRDGNTRCGAMRLLGWTACWVIIWYNTESDYRRHSEILHRPETTWRASSRPGPAKTAVT